MDRRVGRAMAVIALGGLIAGALSIGPATTATKFLTKKKAKKLFYTKAAADSRFLRVDQGLSRGVTRSLSPPFPDLSVNPQEVIDLHTLHDGGDDQRLTTPFAGRILAMALVQVANNDLILIGDVACGLTLTDAAGTALITTTSSRLFPDGATTNLPLTGSVVKPAGQYDVSIECEEPEPGLDVSFTGGHLAVWVLPA